MSAQLVNVITNAIARGMSAKQILNYLIRNNPQHANKINTAMAAGYTADKILSHLINPKGVTADSEQYLTDSEKAKKQDAIRKKQVYLGTAGAGAAGVLGLSGLLGAGSGAIQPSAIFPPLPGGGPTSPRGFPNPPQQLQLPNTGQISPSPQPGPNPAPMQPSPQGMPPNQPIMPQPFPQPSPAPQPTIPSSQLLQSMGQLDRVKAMLNAGNSPDEIAAGLNALMKGDERKAFGQMLKSGQAKPLIEMVKDIQLERQQAQPAPQPMQPQPEPIQQQPIVPEPEQPLPPQEAMPMPEEVLPEPEPEKPIEKKSIVATPHGVGEVKAISGDNAIVEIDGKAKKVPVNELIESPLPEKDLAQLHDDLVKGIEDATEEELSRMVDFAGYDPNTNRLAFLPYTGALYVYDDISPDDASLLRNVLNVRKTSGENFIGAWKKDSKSPIGAAMSALILKLQKERGGKGSEYSGKFETVYKAFEPAIKASKEAKKKRDKENKKPRKTK